MKVLSRPATRLNPSRHKLKIDLNLVRFVTAVTLAAALTFSVIPPQSAAARAEDKSQKGKSKPYREGTKALRQGKYEKAINIFRELLDANKDDIQAHLGIALAYSKVQDYLNCYEHAGEAMKLDPNNARAHAIAGLALLRSGFIASAVHELVQALKLNPKEALAFGAAAEIDYYEGRAQESRRKAYQAFTLDSDESDYLLTFARASSRLEKFGDAADAFERFLEIAPISDKERRDRIQGLIQFYRRLDGVEVHQISGLEKTEIPFRLGSDRRPYLQIRVNGKITNFVIDTGSGFTVISKPAAKRLGVNTIARGGTSQAVGGDGKFPIIYGMLNSIQLGDIKVKSVPCFIRPFHGEGDKPVEQRADGLIGLSVLSHFLTELDYKDSRMRLSRDTGNGLKAIASPDVTVVPFRTTQNGLISIETELDGNHRINAILDSAASSTVISMAAVARLKMQDKIIKGRTVSVIGAAGVSDNVEMLLINNCRVADLQQKNLRALVLDFKAINETSGFEQSGILGGDFLRHFRVTIDFIRAQVAFEPHTSAIERQ